LDLVIRKVKILQGQAKIEADKQDLKDNDLVIVKTIVHKDCPPDYQLEKIVGNPVSYLLNRR